MPHLAALSAGDDQIFQSSPSMVELIFQQRPTVRYNSLPDACCSTCNQLMGLTMIVLVRLHGIGLSMMLCILFHNSMQLLYSYSCNPPIFRCSYSLLKVCNFPHSLGASSLHLQTTPLLPEQLSRSLDNDCD